MASIEQAQAAIQAKGPVGAPRDTYMGRAYKAERSVFSWTGKTPEWDGLLTEKQLRALWDRLWGNVYLRRRYGSHMTRKPPTVRFSSRKRGAEAGAFLAVFGPNSARPWIVAHEMAHSIEQQLPNRYWHAGHGWRWAMVYIDCVHALLGAEPAKLLAEAFATHKVPHKVPRAVVSAHKAAKAATKPPKGD